MVLKKSKSSPKPNKSPKNNKPAAPPLEPPDGLDEALAAVELLHEQTNEFDASVAPSRLLPEAARSCLDALGAREQQPKRVATLPVESTDELVERHAKLMEEKDARCADLLRAKYAMLEEARLGTELASREETAPHDEPMLLALLTCARKSPRLLWLQQPAQGHDQSLSQLFETALTARAAWPNALELDLVNAACSRELQLPYKDERERLNIMELHGKAQGVINQVNDYSMEVLRAHFENTPHGKQVVTLTELSRIHGADVEAAALDPNEPIAILVRMHTALVSSTDVSGPVQTFYPLTEDEQEQLSCAVRYVQHATDFSTAQSGLFMWMHSMSIFAHSVRASLSPLLLSCFAPTALF